MMSYSDRYTADEDCPLHGPHLCDCTEAQIAAALNGEGPVPSAIQWVPLVLTIPPVGTPRSEVVGMIERAALDGLLGMTPDPADVPTRPARYANGATEDDPFGPA